MHTKLFQIFYPRNNNSTTEWYRGNKTDLVHKHLRIIVI